MRFMTEASGPAEPAWWRPVSKSPERPDNGQVNKSAREGTVAGASGGESTQPGTVQKRTGGRSQRQANERSAFQLCFQEAEAGGSDLQRQSE